MDAQQNGHAHTGIVTLALLGLTHSCLAGGPVEPNDICTADLPYPGLELEYPPLYPVYLMREEDGSFFTVSVGEPNSETNARNVQRRVVTIEDAQALCARGVNVKFLEEIIVEDESAVGVRRKAATRVTVLPTSFSIAITNGVGNGGFYLNTFKVASADFTQWTTYDFQPVGFAGKGQHAFTILFFDDVLGHSSSVLNGEGITMGELNGLPNGCGGSNYPSLPVFNSQVEYWWSAGNYVEGAACLSTGMVDGTTYSFNIQANANDWVAYSRNGVAATSVNGTAQRAVPQVDSNWSVLYATTQTGTPTFTLNYSSVARGSF